MKGKSQGASEGVAGGGYGLEKSSKSAEMRLQYTVAERSESLSTTAANAQFDFAS